MSELPAAVWSGTFNVWGIEMRCHVLNDGTRIIEKESFDKFMDAMADGMPAADDDELMAFLRWQKQDPTR
jgi:hypothetical protein